MKVPKAGSLALSAVVLGGCILLGLLGVKREAKRDAPIGDRAAIQKDLDADCEAKLNSSYLSQLSTESKTNLTVRSFFSFRLHTCVQVEVSLDPTNAAAMNYIVSDLTHGFLAAPKWHPSEHSLHVSRTDTGRYHHIYTEGLWVPVSTDPGQQLVADANYVKLTCDYTDGSRKDDESNSCTEIEAYVQFGGIRADSQTYHVVSWAHDEVVATNVDRGLSGATTSTLLIRPEANEVEVIDRTRMDSKQPDVFKGMADKSFGGHYELHGGMFLFDTNGVFFQCNEYGVATDMRLDVVERHHGDVVNVQTSEWNAGTKADHKFTQQECGIAMRLKLDTLR